MEKKCLVVTCTGELVGRCECRRFLAGTSDRCGGGGGGGCGTSAYPSWHALNSEKALRRRSGIIGGLERRACWLEVHQSRATETVSDSTRAAVARLALCWEADAEHRPTPPDPSDHLLFQPSPGRNPGTAQAHCTARRPHQQKVNKLSAKFTASSGRRGLRSFTPLQA